jgi:hypothetical protein
MALTRLINVTEEIELLRPCGAPQASISQLLTIFMY